MSFCILIVKTFKFRIEKEKENEKLKKELNEAKNQLAEVKLSYEELRSKDENTLIDSDSESMSLGYYKNSNDMEETAANSVQSNDM